MKWRCKPSGNGDSSLSCIKLCSRVSGRHRQWPTGSHLQDAPPTPVSRHSRWLTSQASRFWPLPPVSSVNCAGLSSSREKVAVQFNKRRKQGGDQQLIQTASKGPTIKNIRFCHDSKVKLSSRNKSKMSEPIHVWVANPSYISFCYSAC